VTLQKGHAPEPILALCDDCHLRTRRARALLLTIVFTLIQSCASQDTTLFVFSELEYLPLAQLVVEEIGSLTRSADSVNIFGETVDLWTKKGGQTNEQNVRNVAKFFSHDLMVSQLSPIEILLLDELYRDFRGPKSFLSIQCSSLPGQSATMSLRLYRNVPRRPQDGISNHKRYRTHNVTSLVITDSTNVAVETKQKLLRLVPSADARPTAKYAVRSGAVREGPYWFCTVHDTVEIDLSECSDRETPNQSLKVLWQLVGESPDSVSGFPIARSTSIGRQKWKFLKAGDFRAEMQIFDGNCYSQKVAIPFRVVESSQLCSIPSVFHLYFRGTLLDGSETSISVSETVKVATPSGDKTTWEIRSDSTGDVGRMRLQELDTIMTHRPDSIAIAFSGRMLPGRGAVRFSARNKLRTWEKVRSARIDLDFVRSSAVSCLLRFEGTAPLSMGGGGFGDNEGSDGLAIASGFRFWLTDNLAFEPAISVIHAFKSNTTAKASVHICFPLTFDTDDILLSVGIRQMEDQLSRDLWRPSVGAVAGFGMGVSTRVELGCELCPPHGSSTSRLIAKIGVFQEINIP
jgi:hypothetical protein